MKLIHEHSFTQYKATRSVPTLRRNTCVAAMEVSARIANITSKPWAFVSFGLSQKKEAAADEVKDNQLKRSFDYAQDDIMI